MTVVRLSTDSYRSASVSSGAGDVVFVRDMGGESAELELASEFELGGSRFEFEGEA